jgi:hypothetical protein
VKALDAMVAAGSVSSADFMLAKKTANEARLDAEVARLELRNHERIHTGAN